MMYFQYFQCRVDQVIDTTLGHYLLGFLDIHSEHYQLEGKEPDPKTISLIITYGLPRCAAMPFGLRNAGATYQQKIQAYAQLQVGTRCARYLGQTRSQGHCCQTGRIATRNVLRLEEEQEAGWKDQGCSSRRDNEPEPILQSLPCYVALTPSPVYL